jgi:hypothetical protein
VILAPLSSEPSEALLDALTAVLRSYPEVEWACVLVASRGSSAPVPAIGLRLDAGFRQRVNEIIAELRATGERSGAILDVVLLDDATLMRNARGCGLIFYPWRKK